jgi:hypothetical protein
LSDARGIIGRDQQQVQQVARPHLVAGAQIRGGGAVNVGTRDDDFALEIGVVFKEHDGGHHLGNARNRTRVLRVLLPEHLPRLRVVDDGGFGAEVRHLHAALIELEPWLLGFADRARGKRGASNAGGAGDRGGLCRVNSEALPCLDAIALDLVGVLD